MVRWKDKEGRSLEQIDGEYFLVFRIPLGEVVKLLPSPMEYRLTPREEQVLRGIMRGLSDKQIADDMDLSIRTVKFHNSSLYKKMKVTGRSQILQKTA